MKMLHFPEIKWRNLDHLAAIEMPGRTSVIAIEISEQTLLHVAV